MIATSKKVLVVDDEDVVCRSYERVLTNAGFEVAKAHSGPEAIERVREDHYDVILADLKMPGMDGLQVVNKVRESHPQMPVVVITGFPSEDTLSEAARLGVTDYLTKPIAPDVLTQATMQALTAPPLSESAPLEARTIAVAKPAAVAIQMPAAAFPEPLVWPVQPVSEPVAQPAEQVAEKGAVAAKVEPSMLRRGVQLALVPFISIAYVMFLPFLGFALFFGLGAKAIASKLS